jgi:hypothetical protein
MATSAVRVVTRDEYHASPMGRRVRYDTGMVFAVFVAMTLAADPGAAPGLSAAIPF